MSDNGSTATTVGRHRNFAVALVEAEPISFTLEWEGKDESHSETFRCHGVIPAGTVADIFAAVNKPLHEQVDVSCELVRRALVEEDQDRFYEVMHRTRDPVPLEVLTEISAWLFEEYSARPTQPPAG